MKKRGIPSPDIADAFVLTFAYPIMRGLEDDDEPFSKTTWKNRNRTTGY